MDYRDILKAYKIMPSKSLGQNFLVNGTIIKNIVDLAEPLTNKHVLEVGPGIGSLTSVLVKRDMHKLTLIEYDQHCVDYLSTHIKHTNLDILQADALKFQESTLIDKEKLVVISNLPYNISVTLLLKWMENVTIFEKFILMFQKEVADRICAKPGGKSYGKLSVLVQFLCDTTKAFDVSPENFHPSPKIDSSVIIIRPKQNLDEKLKLYPALNKLCTIVFNQRRKMLRNTMKKVSENYLEILEKCNISPDTRPEALTVDEFATLAKSCYGN